MRNRFKKSKEKKEKVVFKTEKAVTGRFYRVEKDPYSQEVHVRSFKGTLIGERVFMFSPRPGGAVRTFPSANAFRTPAKALASLKTVPGFVTESHDYYPGRTPNIKSVKVRKNGDGSLTAFDDEGKHVHGEAFLTRAAAVRFLVKNLDEKIKDKKERAKKILGDSQRELSQLQKKRQRTLALAR